MASEPYKPAGYCPHCGYAIDPGTCPECGKISSTTQLHRVPYWVKRRYTIKRIAKVAIIAGILLGGWYFCFRVQWERWLPTSALLRLQGNASNRMTRELMRRFSSGSLTSEEARRLFTQAIRKPDRLEIRSPWPRSAPIAAKTSIGLDLEGVHCYWVGAVSPVTVDGRSPRDDPDEILGFQHLGCSGCSGTFGLFNETLAPGYHEISVTVTWDLSVSQPSPGYRLSNIISSATGTLLVEDKPVTDYVKPVWSPEIADTLKSRLSAVIIRDSSADLFLRIQSTALPVNLAGRYSFPMGPDAMQRLALDRSATSERQLTNWSSQLNLSRVMHADYIPETCDVQFTPDPALALQEDLEDYFDGVIIWSKCPVTTTRPAYSYDNLKTATILPTQVSRTSGMRSRSTLPGP